MYINEGCIVGIMPIYPQGIDSNMLTECCQVVICDDEVLCPNCKRKIIGYDVLQNERGKVRWKNATRNWRKL